MGDGRDAWKVPPALRAVWFEFAVRSSLARQTPRESLSSVG